jgi:hypothetical protein
VLLKETATPTPDGTVPVLQLPELFQFPFVEFHWWVWLKTSGIWTNATSATSDLLNNAGIESMNSGFAFWNNLQTKFFSSLSKGFFCF